MGSVKIDNELIYTSLKFGNKICPVETILPELGKIRLIIIRLNGNWKHNAIQYSCIWMKNGVNDEVIIFAPPLSF